VSTPIRDNYSRKDVIQAINLYNKPSLLMSMNSKKEPKDEKKVPNSEPKDQEKKKTHIKVFIQKNLFNF